MRNVTKLSISKTPAEWESINRKLSELKKKNISAYIQSEIWKMKRRIDECPDCLAPVNKEHNLSPIKKRPYIATTAYQDMKWIAVKMRVDECVILERIVSNLLNEYPVKL